MRTTSEIASTLTDRYQTTVPEPVRRALKLGKRDKIHYAIQANGAVLLTRAVEPEVDDPALGQFLAFMAKEIATRPEHLQALNADAVRSIQALVADLAVDLDSPLSSTDE